MADHDRSGQPALLGALLGWRRFPLAKGGLVRLEVARRVEEARTGTYGLFDVALSRTQLRALGEDLIRAADEADGRPRDAERRRKWWRL